MPAGYTIALWAVVILIVGLRFVLPGLPLRRGAVTMNAADITLLGAGMLGLVLHCTAMFSRPISTGSPVSRWPCTWARSSPSSWYSRP